MTHKTTRRWIVGDEVTRLSIHSAVRTSQSALDRASLPRLLQSSREHHPFLFADWERVLFLHFLIAPEVLRAYVPPPFELDLYQGQGCISVVAVTMRNFRPCRFDPVAYPFRCIREQRFLNFRTYARWNGEPGAFFIHGWLSRPAGLPVPSNLFGLPYTMANSSYEHVPKNGMIRGNVSTGNHQFSYRALVTEGEQ